MSDNPSNASICHSEPFGKLRINSAKNLMDSGTYNSEILRLTPQNDVVGQALECELRDVILSSTELLGNRILHDANMNSTSNPI